mmetsp:Transcript_113053/g.352382  ORF Transcript_113053/g.352382 Transcript_113053/m.352382 type:complete len:216 (-) Transcript_113053:607-1254(-)
MGTSNAAASVAASSRRGGSAASSARTAGRPDSRARRCMERGVLSAIHACSGHTRAAARAARRPESSPAAHAARRSRSCASPSTSQARRKWSAAASLPLPKSSSTTWRSECTVCSSSWWSKTRRKRSRRSSFSRSAGSGERTFAHARQRQPLGETAPAPAPLSGALSTQKPLQEGHGRARVSSTPRQRSHAQTKPFWIRSSSCRAGREASSIWRER